MHKETLKATGTYSPNSEAGNLAVGNPSHKHKFIEIPWDFARLGKDVIDFTEYYATYKYLYRCKCGAEKVKSSRGLI